MKLLLPAGLALITLGMAVLFVGVISPALFYPGIYVIVIGMIVLAVAGVLSMLDREPA